jgi:sialate O-acetylesterase
MRGWRRDRGFSVQLVFLKHAGTIRSMTRPSFRRFVFCIICVFPIAAHAEVKVSSLFGDHMMIQRGMEAPIWGTAAAGEKVTISINDKEATATADDKGEWRAKVPPLEVGNATTLTIAGDKTEKPLVIQDVLVGDVWICSGQSNMEWPLSAAKNAAEEIKSATDANIRLFNFPKGSSAQLQPQPKGKWEVCTPKSATGFSAVGYFFARDIREKENVPVGLIQNAWGGMPAESFMSVEALKADPDFQPLLDYKSDVTKSATTKPVGVNAPQLASNIYNGMVHPLVPYAIKGVIWYQGESNAGRAEQYRKLFPAMIADWRKAWGQGDFPFLFVQLAGYQPRKSEPGESAWAELREAQLMTLTKSPNTGMAVTIDIGDEKDIHPKNKQDVGKRLALAAEKVGYHKDDVEFSGPIYDSLQVDGDKIRIKFEHAKGLKTSDGSPPKSFAIAGEDKKFVWAEAKIDGPYVVVSAKDVEKPVAVRYAWADTPDVNLYNGADLPASPFRTDDWKLITAGVKRP